MPDKLHPHPTSSMREVLTVLLTVTATALTALTAYAVFDMATTTYVGYEVGLTRSFTTVAALLTLLTWTGVILLRTSSRRDLRAGPEES